MKSQYITCRACGHNNSPTVKQCESCGVDLTSLGTPVAASQKQKESFIDKIGSLVDKTLTSQPSKVLPTPKKTSWLTHTPPINQTFAGTEEATSNNPYIGQTEALPRKEVSAGAGPHPKTAGQRITDRYLIRKHTKHPTGTTVIYDAIDLYCPQCQQQHSNLPEQGTCITCHSELNIVLLHESQHVSITPNLANITNLLSLGQQNHPFILFHYDLLIFPNFSYSVVQHPGRWGYVVPGNRTMDEVIAIITQMGKAINYLHQQNYTLSGAANGSNIIENWVALPGCNEVRLADLTTCIPMSPSTTQHQIYGDIRFLSQVLFYLTSGILSTDPNPSLAPTEFSPYIERALANQYPTPMAFMQDLSGSPVSPIRQLNPSHGQATHPGKKHLVNEDAIVTFTYNKQQSGKAVPVGFYLVADGMGGHEAGDLASRTVNQIVTKWVLEVQVLPDLRKTTRKLTSENIPAEVLERAIAEANEALRRHADNRSSNLGSTVTAALLIGDTATIVNVGDSRTYRMRNGQLDQITRDHSLVARLVETNVISPEEVRSHPRRNEVYRSLGHNPDLKIDTFTVPLQRGDRLILCCDGLWEMVLDEEIARIVQTSRTPQEACDQLIMAANAAGGDDNISVIVVEME